MHVKDANGDRHEGHTDNQANTEIKKSHNGTVGGEGASGNYGMHDRARKAFHDEDGIVGGVAVLIIQLSRQIASQ